MRNAYQPAVLSALAIFANGDVEAIREYVYALGPIFEAGAVDRVADFLIAEADRLPRAWREFLILDAGAIAHRTLALAAVAEAPRWVHADKPAERPGRKVGAVSHAAFVGVAPAQGLSASTTRAVGMTPTVGHGISAHTAGSAVSSDAAITATATNRP